MTAYRAGQRVRIEWPNGSAVEGVLAKDLCRVRYGGVRFWHEVDAMAAESQDGATITVLSEPRPDEPTGLGAVVDANFTSGEYPEPAERCFWVRVADREHGHWSNAGRRYDWSDLVDPVVLSEGWAGR